MPHSPPSFSSFRRSLTIVALLAAAWLAPQWSPGQQPPREQDRAVPREEYFLALRGYYTGEYSDALDAFRRVASRGIRSTQGRWVDSICYHTMAGECYYHMGQPAAALKQYEAALNLAVAHRDWMLRVQFPEVIRPSARQQRIPWGASGRRSRPADFPDTMSSFQGKLNNDNTVRFGGVVTPPQFYPLRVTEVVRCTGLALYRRWELMGPAGEHSPTTKSIVEALSHRSAPANHWSQVWIEAQLGLAQACAGKRAEAIAHLRRAIVTHGEFDHPLTPVVLLALGRLFLEDNRLEAASNYFLEASLAGAAFAQPDVIDEALRHGMTTHLVGGARGAYPPLVRAAPWARSRGFDALQASLLVAASESYAYAGENGQAGKLLDEARRAMARSDMRGGEVGARFQFTSALVNFQSGQTGAGSKALDDALRHQKQASHRLLHISLADSALTGGTISPRVAKDLFAVVLREPAPADWALDPLDTLAVQLSPLTLPMEHWFETALARKDAELAVEISERIRRRRFLSALPLGGRLLSLRWIMEAPKEALAESAVLQRQDLLVKYPHYAELKAQGDAVRAKLAALDIAPADAAALQSQKKLYAQWQQISASQEAVLQQIAVRREPAEIVFPPVRKMKDIQSTMSQGQIVLSYFGTTRGMRVFIFTADKFNTWLVEDFDKVSKNISQLLKEMGHRDGNQPLTADDLRSDAWKKPAAELLGQLLNNPRPEFWDDYRELVVVPDGPLWYLPFESLQIKSEGGGSVSLMSKVRLRYAPTINLALPDGRGHRSKGNTVVVAGKLFPRDDIDTAQVALRDIRRVLPNTTGLPQVMPAHSSIQAALWDRLVVLDDIDDRTTTSFAWSPAQVDRGKPGSRLVDWFELPWGAPDQVILPGFHTPAEGGLRRPASGDEIFLALCGLMSTGTRTVLLSRWRPGGQTSFDLVREFVQELPRTSAAAAWRRSVQLLQAGDLYPAAEPRVKLGPTDELLTADHPFFWAGYLLADTGSAPKLEGGAGRKVIVEIKRRP